MPALPTTPARRFAQLLLGLFLFGIGISLMVRAGIGVAPWDVLTQGVSKQTGLPFGLITNLIGVVVLLLWVPIREKPGVGTVLNVLLVGPSAQFGLWLFPQLQGAWMLQAAMFLCGLSVLAIATGLYIGANFGPGPRDGLMTGLHRRTGWSIAVVRTMLEAAVLATGWWLGGTVGWGTLAFALLIGPMCGYTLRWFAGTPAPGMRAKSTAAAES